MDERRLIRVEGRVQGVTFRASARAAARRLGVRGSARNEADGAVLLDVEGAPAALTSFIEWRRHGPPRARVDRIEVAATDPVGHHGFGIG